MDRLRRRLPEAATIVMALVIVAGLSAAGQFHPWVSPDTPSYLAAATSDTPLAQMRLPAYGWLASWMMAEPRRLAALPWLQVASFVGAAVWLVAALRRLGVSRALCLATGLSLAGSNVLILWSSAVIPESLGHAALLAALAAVVGIAAGLPPAARVLLAGLAVTLAWTLRSSLLPFAALLPVLLLALPGRGPGRDPGRLRLAGLLAIACLAPMLAWSAVRAARVGDFNIVSFGGFQMSGMAALMLTPELALRLPAHDQAAARAIIAGRTTLEARGAAIAVPANSTGQRSFPSVALFYFDILARSHDAVLYGAVAPLQASGESWPAFNARLQSLAVAVIRTAPLSYAAWVIGATARLLGHALVLNAAFVLGCLLLASRITRPAREQPNRRDLHTLLALSAVYLAGSASLVVLTTFPASRYIDSAGLLLPVWPLYAALRR